MKKSKDVNNTKKDLADMKIRPDLYLFTKGEKLMKLVADFTLTLEERRQFYNFIKSVKFPDIFAPNSTKT